jgi:hypothetical protein
MAYIIRTLKFLENIVSQIIDLLKITATNLTSRLGSLENFNIRLKNMKSSQVILGICQICFTEWKLYFHR